MPKSDEESDLVANFWAWAAVPLAKCCNMWKVHLVNFFASNGSPVLLKLAVCKILDKLQDSWFRNFRVFDHWEYCYCSFFYRSQYSCQLGDWKYCIRPMWKVHCAEFKLSAAQSTCCRCPWFSIVNWKYVPIEYWTYCPLLWCNCQTWITCAPYIFIDAFNLWVDKRWLNSQKSQKFEEIS